MQDTQPSKNARRLYEERFAGLPLEEKRKTAAILMGVCYLVALHGNKRQAHCDIVAAKLLNDVDVSL